MSSQFEIGVSQKRLPAVSSGGIRKALFTSTSRRPCSRSTRANSASTAASSRWSQRHGDRPSARRRRSRPRSRRPCRAAARRPRAPCGRSGRPSRPRPPSSSAQPLPIPREAPVTIATRPASALAHVSSPPPPAARRPRPRSACRGRSPGSRWCRSAPGSRTRTRGSPPRRAVRRSTSSHASARMPAMSGTSQWPMSELNIARSCAPSGLVSRAERPRDRRVVGLAAEVEARHEQLAHVLGARRSRSAAHSSSAGGSGSSWVNDSREPGEVGAEARVAVLREQLASAARVSIRAGSRWWIVSRLRFSQCESRSA